MPSPNLSNLSISFSPSISGSAAKTQSGSAYKGVSQSANLSVTGLSFTNGNSNTSSLGCDEFCSFLVTLAAGASSVVDLTALVDFVLQTGVSLARIKGCRVANLSTAQDSTYGQTGSQIQLNGPIPAPVQTSPSTSTSGGSLPATTQYFYVITAITALGETTKSNEQNITTGTGATNTVMLNWDAVPNATGYNIYRGTATGSEGTLIKNIASGSTVTYIETGSESTTAQAPPAFNTAAPPAMNPLNAPANGASSLSAALVDNGGYFEFATPSANGFVAGSNSKLYLYNLDAAHAAAVQLTLIGGTT